jgi:hypothetical protein
MSYCVPLINVDKTESIDCHRVFLFSYLSCTKVLYILSYCFSSLAPLLPGSGMSRGLAKGTGLPRRYSACLLAMAVFMTIFLLHTVILSDSRNFSQVPLLGRTIQVRSSS